MVRSRIEGTEETVKNNNEFRELRGVDAKNSHKADGSKKGDSLG
jgi:hypothetical protein